MDVEKTCGLGIENCPNDAGLGTSSSDNNDKYVLTRGRIDCVPLDHLSNSLNPGDFWTAAVLVLLWYGFAVI